MQHTPTAYFNSNNGQALLAFGSGPLLRIDAGPALDTLQAFIDAHRDRYVFGGLSYDLKNEVEALHSEHTHRLGFPLVLFWAPEYVVEVKDNAHVYLYGNQTIESDAFVFDFLKKAADEKNYPIPKRLASSINKEEYLSQIESLKQHIQAGNIYEINFCQEYFAENVELRDPLGSYFQLNRITQAPYSMYLDLEEFRVLCGSPENYIRKSGKILRSSPIKGTHKRGNSPEEDEIFREKLRNDEKERSENVMIVDLVRNDLSRIATKGTVRVDELFGIYTFETVHQMISTISCELQASTTFTDVLRASFPMGSMTGAPKISAMLLSEEHENFRRGLYSGSLGYIAPNGDFNFNVVIRSLLYNAKRRYISCPVGGAITISSIPENEYEECQVKIRGILDGMYEAT
ncbi:MAG: hypothetical protein A3D92_14795 [Bacteroidetes bacterium RIFCSPHIGHO2_02_FULL_44_7]|nr:MAG: hypothetical protein A3D92_14795 [Bacteroidetes bacterium RIFCSPHIGHO2_02_FULL_44_7]